MWMLAFGELGTAAMGVYGFDSMGRPAAGLGVAIARKYGELLEAGSSAAGRSVGVVFHGAADVTGMRMLGVTMGVVVLSGEFAVDLLQCLMPGANFSPTVMTESKWSDMTGMSYAEMSEALVSFSLPLRVD